MQVTDICIVVGRLAARNLSIRHWVSFAVDQCGPKSLGLLSSVTLSINSICLDLCYVTLCLVRIPSLRLLRIGCVKNLPRSYYLRIHFSLLIKAICLLESSVESLLYLS